MARYSRKYGKGRRYVSALLRRSRRRYYSKRRKYHIRKGRRRTRFRKGATGHYRKKGYRTRFKRSRRYKESSGFKTRLNESRSTVGQYVKDYGLTRISNAPLMFESHQGEHLHQQHIQYWFNSLTTIPVRLTNQPFGAEKVKSGFRSAPQILMTGYSVSGQVAVQPFTAWSLRILLFSSKSPLTANSKATDGGNIPGLNRCLWVYTPTGERVCSNYVDIHIPGATEVPFSPWYLPTDEPFSTLQDQYMRGVPSVRGLRVVQDKRMRFINTGNRVKFQRFNFKRYLRKTVQYERLFSESHFRFGTSQDEAYEPIYIVCVACPLPSDGFLAARWAPEQPIQAVEVKEEEDDDDGDMSDVDEDEPFKSGLTDPHASPARKKRKRTSGLFRFTTPAREESAREGSVVPPSRAGTVALGGIDHHRVVETDIYPPIPTTWNGQYIPGWTHSIQDRMTQERSTEQDDDSHPSRKFQPLRNDTDHNPLQSAETVHLNFDKDGHPVDNFGKELPRDKIPGGLSSLPDVKRPDMWRGFSLRLTTRLWFQNEYKSWRKPIH
jgi:hypothetical protein